MTPPASSQVLLCSLRSPSSNLPLLLPCSLFSSSPFSLLSDAILPATSLRLPTQLAPSSPASFLPSLLPCFLYSLLPLPLPFILFLLQPLLTLSSFLQSPCFSSFFLVLPPYLSNSSHPLPVLSHPRLPFPSLSLYCCCATRKMGQ